MTYKIHEYVYSFRSFYFSRKQMLVLNTCCVVLADVLNSCSTEVDLSSYSPLVEFDGFWESAPEKITPGLRGTIAFVESPCQLAGLVELVIFFIDLCRRWRYIHILTADKLYIVPKAIEIDSQPDVLRVGMWHACHMRWRWILWRSLLSVRSLIRWRSSLNICSLTFARPGLKFRWCHWDLGVDNCAATRLSEETFRWTEFPASGGAWSGLSRCGWYQRGICIVSQPLHWQLLGGAGVKPCGIGRRVGAIPGWSCQ